MQPLISVSQELQADSTLLYQHISAMVNTPDARSYDNLESLNQVADYIKEQFLQYSADVMFQEYVVDDSVYKNVIASFGPPEAERIIIGAHYDVCGPQDGADDNASGVAGVLELARLIAKDSLRYRVDLVAYSLEEPPFFRSQYMGSYIHAKYLKDNEIKVKGMMALEMIGYYSDEPGSQDFPVGMMKWFYGDVGNFIAIVKKFRSGSFADRFESSFRKFCGIPVKSIAAPSFVTGIDFSDHLNYWEMGFPAFMITDTAFFRNKNYHQTTDTIETLNFTKMAKVVDAVYKALSEMQVENGKKKLF